MKLQLVAALARTRSKPEPVTTVAVVADVAAKRIRPYTLIRFGKVFAGLNFT